MYKKIKLFSILCYGSCNTILEYKIAVKCELNTHGKLKKGWFFLFHSNSIFFQIFIVLGLFNECDWNTQLFAIQKNHWLIRMAILWLLFMGYSSGCLYSL